MTASEEAEARTQTVTRTKELIVDILNTKNISSSILLKVYQQLLGIYVEPLIPSNLITVSTIAWHLRRTSDPFQPYH
jgi:hypothetical protein